MQPADPAHYQGKIQPMAAIEEWSLTWPAAVVYHLGCAVKYIARCGRKGSLRDDLIKARTYLDRAIGLVEGPGAAARTEPAPTSKPSAPWPELPPVEGMTPPKPMPPREVSHSMSGWYGISGITIVGPWETEDRVGP